MGGSHRRNKEGTGLGRSCTLELVCDLLCVIIVTVVLGFIVKRVLF